MSYNMYDKNYGSGFTPANDNRPEDQKPAPHSDRLFVPTDSQPAGESRPADDCRPINDGQPVDGAYRFRYGFQPAEDTLTREPSRTVPPVTPPPSDPEMGYQPPEPPKPPKKSRKKSGGGMGRMVALVLAIALVCGLAGAGGSYLVINALRGELGQSGQEGGQTDLTPPAEEAQGEKAPQSSEIQVSDREVSLETVPVQAGQPMTPSQIYDTYSGSVVSIEVQTSSGIGAGTGFVITEDGYVLTCYHVVEGYQAISCTFIDTTSYEAEYIGGDKDADLAVLKITGDTPFKPMVIGNSDLLQVGSTVTTVGNALGTFANTLTSGYVSGLDRALTMSDGTVMNVLQTDCTVNSGNSGGPLFNEYGEVIGVVNAKYSNTGYSSQASIEGIGFAIPINDAMAILEDLMTHGYITGKPYLGISVSTVSSITAQQYSNMVVGAYVRSVEEGSCSEKAGLQVGDIITQVNGADITTYEELIDAKNTLRAGDEMTVTVFRQSTYLTLVITLDEEVPQGAAGESQQEESQQEYSYGYDSPYSYGYDFFDPFSYFGRGW